MEVILKLAKFTKNMSEKEERLMSDPITNKGIWVYKVTMIKGGLSHAN